MVKEKKVQKKKCKKNKRGFTLIELLAVIIILGVLLIIAVPAISRYIEESRRSTYVNSVQSVVTAISDSVNNLEYPVPGKNEAIIIPFSEANIEKGNSKTKSPYAPYEEGKSYVIVTFDGKSFNYYVTALNQSGYSIPLINTKDLKESSITTDTNAISNNVYSLTDIKKGRVLDTYQFSMKYKSKVGNIYKIQIGSSIYNKGEVVQLKDGSKWYVLPQLNENGDIVDDTMENNTVNLISYYHMDTYESNYGLQSNSKTTPYVIYEAWDASKGTYDYANDGTPKYENADIYPISQYIINATKTKLQINDINTTGMTVDMPSVTDFCGLNYTFPLDICGLSYFSGKGDGGFWTKDYYTKNVLAIDNGSVSSTSAHYGSIQADSGGYGIRMVLKNLLKTNIDKAATKKLN